MDYAAMYGDLESVVDGDESRIPALAWDLRTVLRYLQSHTDRDDLVARILNFWDRDISWMNSWEQRFTQAINAGTEEQLADWLGRGAPLQESSAAASVAC